jgi:molecular chaperone IbpA
MAIGMNSGMNPHSNKYPNYEQWDHKKQTITLPAWWTGMDRWAIGFDFFVDAINNYEQIKPAQYPPYNILKDGDDYTIELAVAGFTKDELTITVEEHNLIIEGTTGKAGNTEVVYQGIAARKFKQNFLLAEYSVITGSTLADGILRIYIEQQLPEEKKPKIIEIK